MTLTPLRAISESEPVFVESDVTAADTSSMGSPESLSPTDVGGASVVALERNGDTFTLRVNGVATVVRGVGYNPWYAELDEQQRRALYERDFGQIHATGANMLEGWFEQQFDEATLDAAHANGLGVIMPFELNQDYDYSDPAVQARFLDRVTDWVQRYRGNPAVRMWAPGNEVMHRLISPTLVRGAADPNMELRADDFAAFYVRLMDRIHELDPDHPVLYRDAEDGYVSHLVAALKANPAPRPWLIYGANVYTPRIEQIVRDWSPQTLDAPILFSEFAPSGMSPQDRPRRFEWFWRVIRSRPSIVLGGVVYTWSTAGPEDLDRVFGLTDGSGQPVDGSVEALSRMFRSTHPSRG
jgi:beta-galactosidase/beta-glucuronidase